MCADIVVVGAGPVGLWTAIQIKKRRPNLDVQVYERYEEYQRTHVLHLENLSMMLYSKARRDEHEKAFYKAVAGKDLGKLSSAFKAATGAVYIRTHDLEAALKDYAQALGVSVAYEKIDSPAQAMALHPECRRFVAADGAHSRMREALLGTDATEEFPLQYVVEIKYEAEGRAGKLNFAGDRYKTNKLLSSMAFEYVGKEKQGTTPVTLRFFLDKETYDALPQASFKDPLTLGDDRIPQQLALDIRTYMNARKMNAGEKYKDGSAKISKLTLSMYAARKFAVELDDGRAWFIVGDAAMGVPYFRALNSGMIVGSQLALILSRDHGSNKSRARAYNAMRPLDIGWEFTAARGKDGAIKAFDMFRRMNAVLPWEMFKWNEQDAATLRESSSIDAAPRKKKRRTLRKKAA
ncbi:MAG: FAD-dependent oxidoreductase [Alphaproteobacteria bacterium]